MNKKLKPQKRESNELELFQYAAIDLVFSFRKTYDVLLQANPLNLSIWKIRGTNIFLSITEIYVCLKNNVLPVALDRYIEEHYTKTDQKPFINFLIENNYIQNPYVRED